LALDSEDKKDLGRARKGAERQVAKCRYGKQLASAKKPRPSQWADLRAGASKGTQVVGSKIKTT